MTSYVFQAVDTVEIVKSDTPLIGWSPVDTDEDISEIYSAISTNKPFRIVEGVVEVAPNVRPFPGAEWNWNTGEWVDSRELSDVKAKKWAEIKNARSQAEFSTFIWDSHTFDCDRISQARIQGAVQLAILDPDLVIDWTLTDNSIVLLSAANMIQVGIALGVHVTACHANARIKRLLIDAAITKAEVDLIAW